MKRLEHLRQISDGVWTDGKETFYFPTVDEDGNLSVVSVTASEYIETAGFRFGLATKTHTGSPHTTTGTDLAILVDGSGGAVTVKLDASAEEGQVHYIKCIDDTNACTIDRNGNKIDGEAEDFALAENDSVVLIADSNNDWWII